MKKRTGVLIISIGIIIYGFLTIHVFNQNSIDGTHLEEKYKKYFSEQDIKNHNIKYLRLRAKEIEKKQNKISQEAIITNKLIEKMKNNKQ